MNKLLRLLFIGSFVLLFLVGCGQTSLEYVKPATMFTLDAHVCDNAIFQEKQTVTIKGQSEQGALISGVLKKENRTIKEFSDVVNENDEFLLTFLAPKGSFDSYELIINDGIHTQTIENIRFGSVWLITGEDYDAFNVSYEPEETLLSISVYDGKVWINSEEELQNIPSFVKAYVNGLATEVTHPIGIISGVVEKAHLDSWLNPKLVEDNLRIRDYLFKTGRLINVDDAFMKDYDTMSSLYKQLLEPIEHLAIKGIVWHQGTSNLEDYLKYSGFNVNYFKEYQYMLTQILVEFYNIFDNNIDIYILQDGSSELENIEMLRESQAVVTYLLKYTSVITTYGYGSSEQLIDEVVNAVFNYTYEEYKDFLSPNYINSIRDDKYIKIIFNNCSSLMKEEEYFGLEIYDQDNELIELEIVVDQNWLQIILPEVEEGENDIIIKTIKYAQNGNIDDCNLKNENGIGVVPFIIEFKTE